MQYKGDYLYIVKDLYQIKWFFFPFWIIFLFKGKNADLYKLCFAFLIVGVL